MDRDARIARRRAIIIIVALATIFLLVVIGLVIMGIRSGKIASEKVLRSEFASMLKKHIHLSIELTSEFISKFSFRNGR